MSNMQIIVELCGILHDMADVIEEQQAIIEQHGAVASTEKYQKAKDRYTAMLGAEEWPDSVPGTDRA